MTNARLDRDEHGRRRRTGPARVLRLLLAVTLVASALGGPGASVAGSAPGSTTLPVASDVPSEGAEVHVWFDADDWTPAPDGAVTWTVTVANRAGSAAAAADPWVNVYLDSLLTIESTDDVPAGWDVSVAGDAQSFWASTPDPLAPGDAVDIVFTTSVSAASGDRLHANAWSGASNQWQATPRPGRGAVAGIVVDGTVVSGAVVAADGGEPLEHVCANASVRNGSGWWTTRSRPDGTWDLAVEPGHEVDLRLEPHCQAEPGSGTVTAFGASFHPGVSDPGQGQSLDTSSDHQVGTTGLGPGGAISGTVTRASTGEPADDVWLHAEHSTSGWWVGGTDTRSDGSYLLHGLPPGDHLVRFADDHGGAGYAAQYYLAAYARDDATVLTVAAGTVLTGIDAVMERGGSISGTVTAADGGAPLAGIQVVLGTPDGDWIDGRTTLADGSYHLSGVVPGDYVLRFEDDSRTYLWTFHDGTFTLDDATPFTLDPGEDAVLDIALATGLTVTGQVTAAQAGYDIAAGEPIPDVVVLAWPEGRLFDGAPAGFGFTGPDGTYTMPGVPPIPLTILYVHNLPDDENGEDAPLVVDWAVQFWPGASSPLDAEALDLSGSDPPVTGIDAALVPAPVIRGRVLDAHAGPEAGATGLAGMGVVLFSFFDDDEPLTFAITDEDGAYELRMPFVGFDAYVGAYDAFDQFAGAYPPRWHGGADVTMDDGPVDPAGDGAVALRLGAGAVADPVHVVYDPPDPPGSPTALSAKAGNGSVRVSWTAPSGSTPVDRYAVLLDGAPVATTTATSHMLTGLDNGRTYTIAVEARNLGGTGGPAATTATPTAPATSKPGPSKNDPAPSPKQAPPPGAPSPTPTPSPTPATSPPPGPISDGTPSVPGTSGSPSASDRTAFGGTPSAGGSALPSFPPSPGRPGPGAPHAVTAQGKPVTIVIGEGGVAPVPGTIVPSSVEIVREPDHGTVTVDREIGSVTYEPAPDFRGVDTFDYAACNTEGACGEATIRIRVGPDDPAPSRSVAPPVQLRDIDLSGTASGGVPIGLVALLLGLVVPGSLWLVRSHLGLRT